MSSAKHETEITATVAQMDYYFFVFFSFHVRLIHNNINTPAPSHSHKSGLLASTENIVHKEPVYIP